LSGRPRQKQRRGTALEFAYKNESIAETRRETFNWVHLGNAEIAVAIKVSVLLADLSSQNLSSMFTGATKPGKLVRPVPPLLPLHRRRHASPSAGHIFGSLHQEEPILHHWEFGCASACAPLPSSVLSEDNLTELGVSTVANQTPINSSPSYHPDGFFLLPEHGNAVEIPIGRLWRPPLLHSRKIKQLDGLVRAALEAAVVVVDLRKLRTDLILNMVEYAESLGVSVPCWAGDTDE
jgi:hypothetical protein